MHKSVYRYEYRRSPDQDARAAARHPVIVVGAGPVGLTAAIDLALRGIKVVLLDDADRIGEGSRGICYAKRTLEILDRLGVGELAARGVTWKLGKVFLRDDLVYSFDLQPEDGHKMPAFINLQQYYLEKALVDRVDTIDGIDLRWKNRVVGLAQHNDRVRLTIETPDGPYRLAADWVIAADGARSTIRDLLGLGFTGVTFEDKFLIADVRMAADFPTERRFWFDPPFHSGQSALMHRQPDNVWRIDLQLGPDADRSRAEAGARRPAARESARRARLRARMGVDLPVQLPSARTLRAWPRDLRRRCRASGVAIRRARRQFRHAGRRESRLEARGDPGGEAGAHLLESYDIERVQAADENIGHSTRSTDFIAPHSRAERRLRNAVLDLAPKVEFARRMVNSGRLSIADGLRHAAVDVRRGAVRRRGPARGAGAGCADATRDGRDSGFLWSIYPAASS